MQVFTKRVDKEEEETKFYPLRAISYMYIYEIALNHICIYMK